MIDVRLFGQTVIFVEGVPLGPGALGGVKPRQILEQLAVNLGTPVSKHRLADGLWEGKPPASYIATLESYVSLLRSRLGAGKGKKSPLVTTHSGYMLDPARTRVDLAECQQLLDAPQSGHAGLRQIDQALNLMSGELLADSPYASWAETERETLSRTLQSACTCAAAQARELDDGDRALWFAQVATSQGAFAEAAWQELMQALSIAGRRDEALRSYATLRAGMLDEIGVEPGPASQRIYLSILRDTSGDEQSSADSHEVHTLLQLLRQVLESGGRLDPNFEPELAWFARMLLTRAA